MFQNLLQYAFEFYVRFLVDIRNSSVYRMIDFSVFLSDVNVEKPDERSIITYLATLFDTLESEKTNSPKRPSSPSKPSAKKASSSPSSKGGKPGSHSSSAPSTGEQTIKLKKSSSSTKTKTKDGTSPPKRGDTKSPSPTGKSFKAVSRDNGRTKPSNPKSSTSVESMDASPDIETTTESVNASSKRRDDRSVSPSLKSTAPKKPKIGGGRVLSTCEPPESLKKKRHSLASERKVLLVSGEGGRKKRSSFAGVLMTSSMDKNSSEPTPMEVNSPSSDDEEESEVSLKKKQIDKDTDIVCYKINEILRAF